MDYCVPMAQNDEWAEGLASTVAEEVKRLRNAKTPKWSIRRLAEETEKIGYPIGASVLSNFEYGRRGSRLEVVELLVLATALGVPPAQLLWPNYPDGLVHYLPERMISSCMAGHIFTGRLAMNYGEDVEVSPYPTEIVALTEERDRALETFRGLIDSGAINTLGVEWFNVEVEKLTKRREELTQKIADLGGTISGASDGEG